MKPISPRPHNNLGRVLLRRSQECEAKAREAETKGKTDSAEAAKAKAKNFRQAAIDQFEKAVELDETLLEARLNLGEVYIALNELDKAEVHYSEILKLNSENEKDRETISNFSQACLAWRESPSPARIPTRPSGILEQALNIARRDSGEVTAGEQPSIEVNFQTMSFLQVLASQRFQRGEHREAEKCLSPMLARLAVQQRRCLAEQLGRQCERPANPRKRCRPGISSAWAFATGPDPHILDPGKAWSSLNASSRERNDRTPWRWIRSPPPKPPAASSAAEQTAQEAASWPNPWATSRWRPPFSSACRCTNRESRTVAIPRATTGPRAFGRNVMSRWLESRL